MSQLYAASKNEVSLPIVSHEDIGLVVRSDRMFAAFDYQDEISEFMKRPMVSNFLAKLHHPKHPNHAGFFFILGNDFGLTTSCESQIAIFSDCMGMDKDIYGDFHVFASGLGNDDVADLWLLMTRQWVFTDEMDFGQLDGGYESFRTFFLANSRDMPEQE